MGAGANRRAVTHASGHGHASAVKFLSDRIPLRVLASLTTRAGAEACNAADF
jgi:hypothetical protein